MSRAVVRWDAIRALGAKRDSGGSLSLWLFTLSGRQAL